MSGEDLDLNSLSRFSKKSNHFILETQSHCEVPAGCGGVVLRWRNSKQGIPITFRIYAIGPYQVFLDGQPLLSARPLISFGEHVISIVVSEIKPNELVLLFAAKYEEKGAGKDYKARAAAEVLHFLSAPDSLWKHSLVEPQGNSWQQPGFDDSGWSAMLARDWTLVSDQPATAQSYQARELLCMGARGLGVLGSPTKVWIRRSFSVEPLG
jgi:hypothetical protein